MPSWLGRITGKDKKGKTPEQQTSVLGRTGNLFIISNYGLWADLPDQQQILQIDEGRAIPITQKRPTDTKQAEPVFFHPTTNTRIIPRNDGSLDIITATPNKEGGGGGDGTAPINIICTKANVTASESVEFNTPVANFTGAINAGGEITAKAGTAASVTVTGHNHAQANDSGGNTEANTAPPTTGS